MNIDTKRHKLLKILTKQRKDVVLKKVETISLGVLFDKIYDYLDCGEDELHSITSDLYTSDEIGYHDADNIVGLFAKAKGVTAFANNKYLNRVRDRKKEKIKFFAQTIIPVLALVVAILSLTVKFDDLKLQSDRELQKLKSIIKEQKLRIDTLEINQKNKILKNYNHAK